MDFRPLNIENDIHFDMDEFRDEQEEAEEEGEEVVEEEEPRSGPDSEDYEDFNNEFDNFDSDTNNVGNHSNNNVENDNRGPNSTNNNREFEPYKGMVFESEQSARIFYNSYARRLGFSTRLSSYHRAPDGTVICRQIVCHRQGFRRASKNDVHRHRAITRVGCKAQIYFRRQKKSGKWVVIKFIKEHNHELVPSEEVHRLRSHRHISGHARSLIDTLQAAGMGSSRIMEVLIKESGGIDNVGFTRVDCQNYMSSNKQKTLGNGAHHLLDYLRKKQSEDPEFFFALQNDLDYTSGNIFWAESKSRKIYNYFADTVTFDTTYRSGRYRVPFASFTGLNQHGQPLLLGCALILSESESSFVWLFQTWLAAMSGRHPVSITTDNDRIIRSAIARVLPETRHRFCKWNIFNEAIEKLSQVYHTYPSFEAEFHECINSTETIGEFESRWISLLEKHNLVLEDIEWLQTMYNSRQHWVPVYLRDSFFGEMSTTHSSNVIDSFFDGFINASTSIYVLVKQYEKAITNRHEKEVKLDYDTIHTAPILRTPSPMEKQAATFYTKKIFTRFQEQLIETLVNHATVIQDTGSEITYRVTKYGEDHKAHSVRFDAFEKRARCSCQMFEFSGILCRHILAVFRVSNVLTLPTHYILQRWTRNAKCGVPTVYKESTNTRYENLRREAVRFVEEGADSTYVYNVALEAIREAAQKVAFAKQHVRGVMQGTVADGGIVEGNVAESQSGHRQSHSTDKKVEELTFELENTSRRCEAFRSKLLAIMRDMEEQKLKIAVKVQNERLKLKN